MLNLTQASQQANSQPTKPASSRHAVTPHKTSERPVQTLLTNKIIVATSFNKEKKKSVLIWRSGG